MVHFRLNLVYFEQRTLNPEPAAGGGAAAKGKKRRKKAAAVKEEPEAKQQVVTKKRKEEMTAKAQQTEKQSKTKAAAAAPVVAAAAAVDIRSFFRTAPAKPTPEAAAVPLTAKPKKGNVAPSAADGPDDAAQKGKLGSKTAVAAGAAVRLSVLDLLMDLAVGQGTSISLHSTACMLSACWWRVGGVLVACCFGSALTSASRCTAGGSGYPELLCRCCSRAEELTAEMKTTV